jgi:hypothetical protein
MMTAGTLALVRSGGVTGDRPGLGAEMSWKSSVQATWQEGATGWCDGSR